MFKKLGTLKVKFSVITFITYLTLVTVVLVACYYRFYLNTLAFYKNQGNEILDLAMENIKVNNLSKYLTDRYNPGEYDWTQGKLNQYEKHFRDIYALYVYQISEQDESAIQLFGTNTAHGSADACGSRVPLKKGLAEHIDLLRQGLMVEPIIDNTPDGYLMTCSRPLIDSNGKCQGYLFVDFNLTSVRQANTHFVLGLFLLAFTLMCVIFTMGMKAVADRITKPLEKMYLCLSGFRYASDKDREDNIKRLKELNIHTNTEIQSLYEALVANTEESYNYMHEYRRATEQLDVATEKAYTDVLTGYYNKTAYEDKMAEYQQMMNDHELLCLSIVMLDINNLKYVNDTFGHERGDQYIKNCCGILSKFCGKAPVYRIGGDEFVIFLAGNDYENRKRIYDSMIEAFRVSQSDMEKQPWERCSASIGISDCLPGDTDIADLFKRADDAMYLAKTEFKAKHGSYR